MKLPKPLRPRRKRMKRFAKECARLSTLNHTPGARHSYWMAEGYAALTLALALLLVGCRCEFDSRPSEQRPCIEFVTTGSCSHPDHHTEILRAGSFWEDDRLLCRCLHGGDGGRP